MAVNNEIILGNEIMRKVAEALGVDFDHTRRIILDWKTQSPIVAYVEMYGTDRFYEINFADLSKATEVKLNTEEQ